ncbi:MAG: DUF481 domain-containing protein [Sulfuricurvum sp.]|jgi:hypothetical protein|uniref:DUF481 domain-containing protein n=1 Tax=Sulfuricurvum sp. TaxID=2025608 RepID=UPI0025EC6F9A|nr:DUF481 domain-containing protein [Sulfuricurvum sp.]MCK9372334.1 DUF481 domain-containing protein [Sulfuricurvum sp.]
MRYAIVLICLFSTTLFALVSIAPVDIGANPGISGNISGALSSKSGNTQKEDYALGVRLQYDQGEKYLTWGALTYDYGKSKGVKNEDKIYLHIRTIHALEEGKNWTGELFVQSEQDKFKAINERSLAGAGLRLRFFNSDEWGKGYVGAGPFYEKIDYTYPAINPNENNTRLNTYIAYTKKFIGGLRVSYLGYYQPSFAHGGDYTSSQTIEMIAPLYAKLSLSLSGKYLYDTQPAIGIKKEDTAYLTTLLWSF